MLSFIAIFYGVLVGNYLTTCYFRIPKNIPINGLSNTKGKVPHCSTCNHKLKFYEYLPVLSWFSTKFKCNYCNAAITKDYFILEVSVMLSSLALYLFIGMNLLYSALVLVIAALALNLALFLSYKKLFKKALYILLISIFSIALVFC